jgi:hypothetical protein
LDKISYTSIYGEGIIQSDLLITFSSPDFSTKDGIKVGLTKEQVLKKLGKPNLMLKSEWSYLVGDYLKFKLLFDHNKVKFMSLRIPV